MDKNICELSDLVDSAYQHNFENIYVDNFVAYTKEMSEHSLFNHINLANLHFKRAEKKSKELGIGLSVPCFDFQQNMCHDPFITIYITWDGKVVPINRL